MTHPKLWSLFLKPAAAWSGGVLATTLRHIATEVLLHKPCAGRAGCWPDVMEHRALSQHLLPPAGAPMDQAPYPLVQGWPGWLANHGGCDKAAPVHATN